MHPEVHPKGRRGTDQPGAAHMHVANRACHILHGRQAFNDKFEGKQTLIDDPDYVWIFRIKPDGAIVLTIYQHRDKLSSKDDSPWMCRKSSDKRVFLSLMPKSLGVNPSIT